MPTQYRPPGCVTFSLHPGGFLYGVEHTIDPCRTGHDAFPTTPAKDASTGGGKCMPLYRPCQPHFTKISFPAADSRKSANSLASSLCSERPAIATPHER